MGASDLGQLSADGYAYKQLRRLGLSDAVARAVQPDLKVRSFDAGSPIWVGSTDAGWALIMSGMVTSQVAIKPGFTVPLGVYGVGSWFGENPMLSGFPNFSEYASLSDTDVLMISRSSFNELLESQPAFSANVARLVGERFRRNSEALTLQKAGTPCAKVVMGLAHVAEALVLDHELGHLRNKIDVPIPQALLAAICGVSRTVFSTYVLQVQSMGWVEVSYGRLELVGTTRWMELMATYRTAPEALLANSVDDLFALLEQK